MAISLGILTQHFQVQTHIKISQHPHKNFEIYQVLEQLDDITSNCSKLDYLAARAGYMKLTLGAGCAENKRAKVIKAVCCY